jgi:hypothetical protein
VPTNRSPARTYEIRIGGELGPALLSLPRRGRDVAGSSTVLTGVLTDCSALVAA